MQTSINQDESLLTFKEAMSYLRVSQSTLNRWLKDGTISGHKVGYTWRFFQEDLRKAVKPTRIVKQGEEG